MNNRPGHGNIHPWQPFLPFQRIRRCFRHHRNLVAAVAVPILPESLLRSLVAKFLSIRGGLSGHYPFVLFRFGRAAQDRHPHGRSLLVPCLPNVVHQITQVVALFYMGPGVYAIFIRSSVIFTAFLALAFFPEERSVIRQWQFQVGTLLGLVGAFGVIWFQPNGQDQHIALPGLLIAFTASLCWALYAI